MDRPELCGGDLHVPSRPMINASPGNTLTLGANPNLHGSGVISADMNNSGLIEAVAAHWL